MVSRGAPGDDSEGSDELRDRRGWGPHLYKLVGHAPVRMDDMNAWGAWFGGADRVVAQDDIGAHRVSTVFLGIDHEFGRGPPLLFETMVFTRGRAEFGDRYSTWDEAFAGHQAICQRLKEPAP